MKIAAWLMTATALACSAPALAGEEVLYGPAPEWIAPVELPAVRPGPPIVLYDDQRRIEEGRLSAYVDRAIRIDNPQTLTAIGTVQAQWQPDKGDLLVHRVTSCAATTRSTCSAPGRASRCCAASASSSSASSTAR